MKSRTLRLLGREFRLTGDGPAGRVINTASQEHHMMLQLRFGDGSVRWTKLCDAIPAEDPAPPTAKARRPTKKG
jgi:hypothetical protein